MSRSYRKSPCKSWANSGSMKAWRTAYNQKHRHNQKQLLEKFLESADWDNYIPRIIREDSNVYDSPMDGNWGWWTKPKEEESYNPRTDEYDWCWKTEKYWKEIFRK